MKIRITKPIPIAGNARPVINGVYDVVDEERRKSRGGKQVYFIEADGERVGVYSNECEIVKEAEA